METFSDCDEARNWALSLQDDLPLCRAGELPWEEMSGAAIRFHRSELTERVNARLVHRL
jgi:hypothetical protein